MLGERDTALETVDQLLRRKSVVEVGSDLGESLEDPGLFVNSSLSKLLLDDFIEIALFAILLFVDSCDLNVAIHFLIGLKLFFAFV